MQAPGFRMNEREANPNPFIGFIRSLKSKADHTDAESILKAVAAQMKKIMEQRFMFVGTLEEAAHNPVFAGRNWNHGQTIELVLRRPNGRFLPMTYITSVMCHEMAHIGHMNHGPKFQKLMAEIKADVRQMQARGYFGDGFWSDGRRLKDSVKMGGEGLQPADFPEYVCGVTAGDARKARRPRRGGPTSSATPGMVKGEASHRSGRQTEYKRKAGRRNNVDMGASSGRLDGKQDITKDEEAARRAEIDAQADVYVAEGMDVKKAKAKAAREWKRDNPWYTEGNTRGKVAKSKSAAELRAEAAERRLAGLKPQAESVAPIDDGRKPVLDSDDDDLQSDDEDVPDPHIDPQDRKRQMEQEMSEAEKTCLRGGWEDIFPSMRDGAAGSTRKRELPEEARNIAGPAAKKESGGGRSMFGHGLVEEERKKALGLGRSSGQREERMLGTAVRLPEQQEGSNGQSPTCWSCKLCTYANAMEQGRCEMCGARPNGELPEDIA